LVGGASPYVPPPLTTKPPPNHHQTTVEPSPDHQWTSARPILKLKLLTDYSKQTPKIFLKPKHFSKIESAKTF